MCGSRVSLHVRGSAWQRSFSHHWQLQRQLGGSSTMSWDVAGTSSSGAAQQSSSYWSYLRTCLWDSLRNFQTKCQRSHRGDALRPCSSRAVGTSRWINTYYFTMPHSFFLMLNGYGNPLLKKKIILFSPQWNRQFTGLIRKIGWKVIWRNRLSWK